MIIIDPKSESTNSSEPEGDDYILYGGDLHEPIQDSKKIITKEMALEAGTPEMEGSEFLTE